MVTGFAEMWALLQSELREPTPIRNWTRDCGFAGKDFTAQATPGGTTCLLPGDRKIYVPRRDIERVFALWDRYCAGEVPRHYLRDEITRHSKYIISILHQFLDAG